MRRAVIVLVVALLASTAQAQNLTISFLDVGQGDAILIRSPEGKTALVDAGPDNGVMKVLQKEGVDRIDLVITSHHHADHIGGMKAVIEKYKPKVYVDAGSTHTSATYKKLLEAVNAAGCQLAQPKADSERKIGLGSVALLLFPQPPQNNDENNNSVGIRLEYGDFSVLLTGDSEANERSWWLSNADASLCRPVTILKAAHHGSYTGTNLTWLRATKPELVVISCGKDNKFHHPHKETLDLLEAQRIPFKRTDVDGTIKIESDGRTWKILQRDGQTSLRRASVQLAA